MLAWRALFLYPEKHEQLYSALDQRYLLARNPTLRRLTERLLIYAEERPHPWDRVQQDLIEAKAFAEEFGFPYTFNSLVEDLYNNETFDAEFRSFLYRFLQDEDEDEDEGENPLEQYLGEALDAEESSLRAGGRKWRFRT